MKGGFLMEKEECGPLFSVSLPGWGFLGMAGGLLQPTVHGGAGAVPCGVCV